MANETEIGAGTPPIQPLASGLGRYALVLLFAISVLNYLDRQIVNILAEDIRNELGLRDWQIGAMTGIAFALFYSILGLPIARLAERGHRPRIIAVAIILWSIFTAVGGLAQTFVQFALARVGVGVGEAGCTPPAHSLISDYVPKEKRASALAFFAMGGPVGGLLGLAIGGLVGDHWGWRAAFVVVAIPGVILGLIAILTLPEPRRVQKISVDPASGSTFLAAFKELRASRTYWLFVAATTMMAVVSYGHSSFLASFFLRNHAADLSRMAAGFGLQSTGFLGLTVGLIMGSAGVLGAFVGGQVADRLAARSAKGYATLAAFAAFGSVPTYIAAMMAPSGALALGLLVSPYFIFNLALGPMYAVPQSVVRPQLRATAVALMFLSTNLVGLGIGPLAVGIYSDHLQAGGRTDGEAVRIAQILITLVGILAAGFYWRARKYIERDIVS